MPKQIQIDFDLFCDLLAYFSDNESVSDKAKYDEIYQKLSDKAEKIINRELFTRYKRAPTAEEREKYRQMYLDQRGISQSFRSDKEVKKETAF